MYNLITVNELAALKDKIEIQIIDIRDQEEFEKGHLPGACNITDFFYFLSESSPEGLETMVATFSELLREKGIKKESPVIIYEEELDKKYGGSCRGAFLMTLFGHEEVYVLHGGYSSWVQHGLPVTTEVTAGGKSEYNIKMNKTWYADYSEMLAAIDDDNIYILDNRDSDEWIGVSSSPYGADFSPRKGRIPGAQWIEWYKLMETVDEIPMFKSDEEIRKIAGENGITPDTHVIIYCFKGSRAANTLLALQKAGFANTKVYFASWFEWAKRPELPVDDSVIQ